MTEGSILFQKMPSYVPGRDYLSSSRASLLKVPYNKREANLKLAALELNFAGNRDLTVQCLNIYLR